MSNGNDEGTGKFNITQSTEGWVTADPKCASIDLSNFKVRKTASTEGTVTVDKDGNVTIEYGTAKVTTKATAPADQDKDTDGQ